MAAPVVQSVEQIISDLNPAYQGSIDVISQRRAALPTQFQAQRSGLEAEKVVGFNQINNQATGRGMSFSGIPLDEQANYLSTKYLPGMQRLALQENEQNLALDEALAGINKERRLKAMDIRSNQQSVLERYLAEERERAWQREKFQADQAMERAKMAQDMERAKMAQATERAKMAQEASLAANQNSGRNIEIRKQKNGGWDVYVDGKRDVMDLATAAKATGGNVLSYLANGSPNDRKAYQKYVSMGGGDKGYDYLRNKTGAFYLGGGF